MIISGGNHIAIVNGYYSSFNQWFRKYVLKILNEEYEISLKTSGQFTGRNKFVYVGSIMEQE
jgi:hypothetical protein